MINFRFHLVSLVAVFLALAVGVVMGYGVLGQPTVETLENRIDNVEANADARRAENDLLKADVELLESQLDALEPFSVTDRLAQVNVLLVAVRGVETQTVQGLVQLARRAGAEASGILWIEDKWTLGEQEDREALSTALDVADAGRAQLRARGWEALIDRLNEGSSLGTSDVLTALSDAGFVTFEGDGSEVPFTDIGGPDTAALLVVGSEGTAKANHVLVPAARAAVDVGFTLAAAELFVAVENGPARGALVALVRDDEALAAAVSTVDDLDRPSGSAVSLLMLADLLRGVVGHYGFGEGATATTPEWWQP